MISDKFNRLFYIEPTIEQKSEEPIDDVLTEYIQKLWDYGITQHRRLHMGYHTVCDDTRWNGETYLFCSKEQCAINLIKVAGGTRKEAYKHIDEIEYPLTHAGCVHYVRWFRSAIPSVEWTKLIHFHLEHNILGLSTAEHNIVFYKMIREQTTAMRRETARSIKINIKL